MGAIDITERSITDFVPIEFRRRNGRPRIAPPDDASQESAANDQASATVIRAIARAWDWRGLEKGQMATLRTSLKPSESPRPPARRVSVSQ